MAFVHVPDDDTKYIYLYPPPDVAISSPNAKRVRRYGPDGPSGPKSDEYQSLLNQGWTTGRWAKLLYSPDYTSTNKVTTTVYSPAQLAEAIEEGWLESVPAAQHPHANDAHRQRFLKSQEDKSQPLLQPRRTRRMQLQEA